MSDVTEGTVRFGELSTAHREIRDLVERFGGCDMDRVDIAERLCIAVAKHRSSGTESVLHHAAVLGPDHEQQGRLLTMATNGIEQLVDRLRLPARDPQLVGGIVEALRTLVEEHERLEREILLAES